MGILGAILGTAVVLLLCGIGFSLSSMFGWLKPDTASVEDVEAEAEKDAEAEAEADKETEAEAEADKEADTANENPAAEDVPDKKEYFWYKDIKILLTIGVSAIVWLLCGLLDTTDGNPAAMLLDAVLTSGLTVLAWIDLRRKIVPNKFLAVLLLLWGITVGGCVIYSPASGVEMLFRGVAGAVMSGSVFLLTYLLTRKQVGGGDVKLAFLMGLYLTGARIIGAIFYGALLSSLFALVMLAAKKIKWKDGIPMVPFLYIGTLIVLLIS